MEPSVYRAHFKLQDYHFTKLIFHEGLGAQSLIFVIPGAILALPLVLLKQRKTLDVKLFYLLILPILLYLVYRYVIPLPNTRYLFPLLGVGMILGFLLAKILKIPDFVMNILVVISVLASMPELAQHQELIGSLLLTAILFFALRPGLNFLHSLKPKKLFVGIIFLFLVLTLAWGQKYYRENEYSSYSSMVKYSGFWPDAVRAWDWLNRNTEASNIAYAGRPVPFPLYGTDFKNSVYYVSINAIDPVKLHYFPNGSYHWGYDFLTLHKNLEEDGNYRTRSDYNVWLNNLLRRKTGYLFVYSLHQTREVLFPIEDEWAGSHPGRFVLLFENATVHIYKIIS